VEQARATAASLFTSEVSRMLDRAFRASSDPLGRALSYSWVEGSASDESTVLGSTVTLAVPLPPGSRTFTVAVAAGGKLATQQVAVGAADELAYDVEWVASTTLDSCELVARAVLRPPEFREVSATFCGEKFEAAQLRLPMSVLLEK